MILYLARKERYTSLLIIFPLSVRDQYVWKPNMNMTIIIITMKTVLCSFVSAFRKIVNKCIFFLTNS